MNVKRAKGVCHLRKRVPIETGNDDFDVKTQCYLERRFIERRIKSAVQRKIAARFIRSVNRRNAMPSWGRSKRGKDMKKPWFPWYRNPRMRKSFYGYLISRICLRRHTRQIASPAGDTPPKTPCPPAFLPRLLDLAAPCSARTRPRSDATSAPTAAQEAGPPGQDHAFTAPRASPEP